MNIFCKLITIRKDNISIYVSSENLVYLRIWPQTIIRSIGQAEKKSFGRKDSKLILRNIRFPEKSKYSQNILDTNIGL